MSATEAVHDTEFAVKIWIHSCEVEKYSLQNLEPHEDVENHHRQKEVRLIRHLVKNLPREDRQEKLANTTIAFGMG